MLLAHEHSNRDDPLGLSPPPLLWHDNDEHMLTSTISPKCHQSQDVEVASANASTTSQPAPLSVSGPCTPAALDDYEGLRMLDDMDMNGLTCEEEPLMTMGLKDDQLLAMLGTLARSAPLDPNDDDASSGVVSLLPDEVQEEDPEAIRLRKHCAILNKRIECQVEATQKMEASLRAACAQIQARSEKQHEEQTSLVQRVQTAKQTLGQKIADTKEDQQRITQSLDDAFADCEHYKHEIVVGVPGLLNDEKEANRQAHEEGELTAILTKELKRSRAREVEVLAELQEHRLKNYHESTHSVAAIAQCGSQQLVTPHTGCSVEPLPPTKHRHLPKDLHLKKTALESQRASDSERLAPLQDVCDAQEVAIRQLRQEITLQKQNKCFLDKEFASGLRRAKQSGIQLSTASREAASREASEKASQYSSELSQEKEGDRASLSFLVEEAEALVASAQEFDERYAKVVVSCQEVQQVFDENQLEVGLLCERLEQQQTLSSNVEEHLFQFRSHCAELTSKIHGEQEALDQAHANDERNKEQLRAHVQKTFQAASQIRQETEEMREQLERGGHLWCCFRRPRPAHHDGDDDWNAISVSRDSKNMAAQRLASREHAPPPPPPLSGKGGVPQPPPGR